MKTDRELLEKAAKAIGMPKAPKGCEIPSHLPILFLYEGKEWNPLADDGDALRLAVKLRLTVSWDRFEDYDYATATPPHTHQGHDCIVDQDPQATTRRAIVRAAAAIGEGI